MNKNKVYEIKENWLNSTWEEVATFIGPNAQAFKPIWEKHHTSWREKGIGAFGFSWCWPALIPMLGIPWAAARKNWFFVYMMVALIVVVNIIAFILPNTASHFSFLAFFAPSLAKPFYVQQAVTKIAQIKREIPMGVAREVALADAGGLNMRYGYVAGAICAAFLTCSILLLVR